MKLKDIHNGEKTSVEEKNDSFPTEGHVKKTAMEFEFQDSQSFSKWS